jgi:uncharacterized protein YcaQ
MRQRLAGPQPPPDSTGIMDVMRDIGYVQIDPMRVVERSHLLVLWSRLGPYDPAELEKLLWKKRQLFEDWAQATSIVLTEDYPIFNTLKRSFATGDEPYAKKIHAWMSKNRKASHCILARLQREGPLTSDSFQCEFAEDWRSTGWTSGRNVDMMLMFLWAQGKIMISGRENGKKMYDLTERYLPECVPKDRFSKREVLSRVAQKSLRALGVGTPAHIQQHYIRGCCRKIEKVLADLEGQGLVKRVRIRVGKHAWPELWYVHVDDVPLLDRLVAGEWKPRTTLLSPFDNLICDRHRAKRLFDFDFRFEVYVPKRQRRYGCYVMPILHGDRFIGRIDSVMDRKHKRLMINDVYAEPDAPKSKETALAIAKTIKELGTFLGAEEIQYGPQMPTEWARFLRSS